MTTIPLDKILTIGLRDYVESRNKLLDEYELKGVHLTTHASIGNNNRNYEPMEPIETFAKLVPQNAVAVVNYQVQIRMAGRGTGSTMSFAPAEVVYNQTGVALIPK